MTANLLQLQEMLRNLDMPSVQKVAAGESGKAAQILGMDEIKRRTEMLSEMESKQGEKQMQEPALVDQYLAMSQQVMGQPAQSAPQAPPIQSQGGIMGMMPQDQMQPQMDVPTQMMYGGGSVRKFQTGGGIPPQARQQMMAFNLYDTIRRASGGGREEIIRKIRQEAIKQGVDPNLAVATAMTESGLDPMAVSPAGAQGLFQLMPGTQIEVGVSNPFNVDENIAGGVSYIDKMAERFPDSEDAIRAYNWGQGNMGNYLTGRYLSKNPVGAIPEETRNYLTRVQTIQNLLGYNPIVETAGDDFPQTPFSPDGVGYLPAPDLTMQSQVPTRSQVSESPPTLEELMAITGMQSPASGIPTKGIDTDRNAIPEPVDVANALAPGVYGESQMKRPPREYGSIVEEKPDLFFASPGEIPSKASEESMVDATDEMFDEIIGKSRKIRVTPETYSASETTKSRNLQPLFDAMMRGGLEFASGKNIGEAGIAGLNQATTLAQQRRENARRDAAGKLAERVGESNIALNKARGEALEDTYYQAAKVAQAVLAKDPKFFMATPAEQQRLLSELISSIQSRGLGGGISGIPANTERFNAAFGAM